MRPAAFVDFRCISLDPAPDTTGVHLDAALGHQLGHVFISPGVWEVPTDALHDHLTGKMAAFEGIGGRDRHAPPRYQTPPPNFATEPRRPLELRLVYLRPREVRTQLLDHRRRSRHARRSLRDVSPLLRDVSPLLLTLYQAFRDEWNRHCWCRRPNYASNLAKLWVKAQFNGEPARGEWKSIHEPVDETFMEIAGHVSQQM